MSLSDEEVKAACVSPPKETEGFLFQQTMLRVKDPKKSLDFYTRVMGMTLLLKLDFPEVQFSLYFMAYEKPEDVPVDKKEAAKFCFSRKATLELTHFHHSYHLLPEGSNMSLSDEEVKAACVSPPKETEGFLFQQTMLRVKDPKKSLDFYTRVMGMTLLLKLDFPEVQFSLYFMAYEKPEDVPVDKKEAAKFCFSRKATLELTHNWDNTDDYHNGNDAPRGFGHIGMVVPDVYEACERFEKLGVPFVKKPDAGKMKGLAFIKDPDGYWVEILNPAKGPDLF